jgi:hypothetical protein
MGFSCKTKFDHTDKMRKAAKSLDGVKVYAGVLTGEHQWLAGIHEYGAKIPVTPKMRAYLHSIGVHLKKSTTLIVIPERSFLRAGYDTNREQIMRKAEMLLNSVLTGRLAPERYFEIVGTQLRDAIKDYAIELSDPPKVDWPTRPAGFDNPLIGSSSADMVNGIEYEVEK